MVMIDCGSRMARAQTVLATVTLDGRLLLCTLAVADLCRAELLVEIEGLAVFDA